MQAFSDYKYIEKPELYINFVKKLKTLWQAAEN